MRIQIVKYDDGDIMEVEEVDEEATELSGLDSKIIEVSEETGNKILKDYWTAVGIFSYIKGL